MAPSDHRRSTLPAGTPGAAMSAHRASISSSSRARAERRSQLVEKRLVIVHRDHLGAQRIRQHQRRAPAAAAEVEHARRGRELRQTPQRLTRAVIAARPLPRQPLEQAKQGPRSAPPWLCQPYPWLCKRLCELLGCASLLLGSEGRRVRLVLQVAVCCRSSGAASPAARDAWVRWYLSRRRCRATHRQRYRRFVRDLVQTVQRHPGHQLAPRSSGDISELSIRAKRRSRTAI